MYLSIYLSIYLLYTFLIFSDEQHDWLWDKIVSMMACAGDSFGGRDAKCLKHS